MYFIFLVWGTILTFWFYVLFGLDEFHTFHEIALVMTPASFVGVFSAVSVLWYMMQHEYTRRRQKDRLIDLNNTIAGLICLRERFSRIQKTLQEAKETADVFQAGFVSQGKVGEYINISEYRFVNAWPEEKCSCQHQMSVLQNYGGFAPQLLLNLECLNYICSQIEQDTKQRNKLVSSFEPQDMAGNGEITGVMPYITFKQYCLLIMQMQDHVSKATHLLDQEMRTQMLNLSNEILKEKNWSKVIGWDVKDR